MGYHLQFRINIRLYQKTYNLQTQPTSKIWQIFAASMRHMQPNAPVMNASHSNSQLLRTLSARLGTSTSHQYTPGQVIVFPFS